MKCNKCGTDMVKDNSKILTSIPPKCEFYCPKCGNIQYGDLNSPSDATSAHKETVNAVYTRTQFSLETWLNDQTQKVFDGPTSDKEVEIIKWDANPQYPVVALVDGIAFNFTENGESQYGTSFTTLYIQERMPELTELENVIFRELFNQEVAIDNIPRAKRKAQAITNVVAKTLPKWKREPEQSYLSHFLGVSNNRLYVNGLSVSIPDLVSILPTEKDEDTGAGL